MVECDVYGAQVRLDKLNSMKEEFILQFTYRCELDNEVKLEP
jgi:hypothetical protein